MVVTCPGFDEIGHTVVKALRGFPMKRQPMPERKDMPQGLRPQAQIEWAAEVRTAKGRRTINFPQSEKQTHEW